VIAAWGKGRSDQWRALLKARAIENQAFVIGVNRVGSEPAAVYSGDSSVFGPRGEELLYCGDAEAVFCAELDTTAARKWREAFPVIRDRRE
jgi:omega-amidase